jgi:uncharacterized protein
MPLTQHASSGINIVRGYRDGAVRINDQDYHGTLIVSSESLLHIPAATSLEAVIALDMAPVRALQPELILLGTGARQVFPPPAFSAPFLRSGVGVEIMDTGAACRTYNVLVSEQRRVVAILLT